MNTQKFNRVLLSAIVTPLSLVQVLGMPWYWLSVAPITFFAIYFGTGLVDKTWSKK